jgi:exosortase A
VKPESDFLPARSARIPATTTHLVAAIGICIAGLVVLYWPTAKSLVATWAATDTFQHGFAVVPISLWLAWRLRDQVSIEEVRPFWHGLGLVAIAGIVWLLGDLAAALSVQHLAFVLAVQAALVTIIGVRAASTFAFPIGFLLFAVPVGEAFVPTLMDWTADFVVAALRASGVPVYRTGIHFVIPSGAWSVVEGCSGVRYLIASVMVGTLYGYLTYRSYWRRLAFIGLSILVPIVANWLRAYMIVMIGHLSENRYAAGVDHLVYGWVFFGVVILAMFAIGSLWREDDAGPDPARGLPWPVRSPAAFPYPFREQSWAAMLLVLAVAAIWPLAARTLQLPISREVPALAEIPGANGWTAAPRSEAAWAPSYVGHRAVLHQRFAKGDRSVGLYIAYYRDQRQDAELVNSRNVLVSTRDRIWREAGRGTVAVRWAGDTFEAGTAELESQGARLQAWRWYWIDGWSTSSDYVATALLVLGKLAGRGDEAAAIVLYAPEDDRTGSAAAALEEFARDMAGEVNRALERTRSAAQ